MQSLHETRERILELAEPIEAIEVPLSEAVGLVLAEPHFADVDLPPFDRSALAGYAVRSADASSGRSLRLLDDPKIFSPAEPSAVPLSSRVHPIESEEGRNDFDPGFGFEADFDSVGVSDDLHLFSPFEDDDDLLDDQDSSPSIEDVITDLFDFGVELGPDEAVWVNSGDPMPIGADAVAAPAEIREEQGLGGGPPRHIELIGTIEPGRNVLPRGHFLRAGAELERAGTRLSPAMVGLLAAQGCVHPVCHRRVRVAVLAVGDQLVPPGEAPTLHRERNAAGLTVAIPCIQWGAMVHDLGTVPNADLDRAIARATTAPVVLVLGPDSAGISEALNRAGLEIRVSEAPVDPCDDLTYGVIRAESGRIESHVFRLPSNPIAALVATVLFVHPLIARLQGEVRANLPHLRRAVWAGPRPSAGERTRVLPVRIEQGEDAQLLARPISHRGVDDLAGFAQADALALLPPGTAGELVEIVPIGLTPSLSGF